MFLVSTIGQAKLEAIYNSHLFKLTLVNTLLLALYSLFFSETDTVTVHFDNYFIIVKSI